MTGPHHVSLVLWDGKYFGGAETISIALAREIVAQGHAARVLFVGEPGVYQPVLERAGVDFDALGLPTGASVLLHPRALVSRLESFGSTVAILPSAGFLARATRLGGFRGIVLSVEHGGLLQFAQRGLREKARDTIDRGLGLGCPDAQVAVSNFLLERLLRVPHAAHVEVIHNGVELGAFGRSAAARAERREADQTVVFGIAGKLIRGKGLEDVVAAASLIDTSKPWRVLVAGSGPLESTLVDEARACGVEDRLEFLGWIDDMPSFWAQCDVAIAASNSSVESFGMTVAEAFASGIPALVSRSGALTEVLGDSGAGASFDAGDTAALSRLMTSFVEDDAVRATASEAATVRAKEFSIETTARGYLRLIDRLEQAPEGRRR